MISEIMENNNCNRCSSKEYCEHRKDKEMTCPYNELINSGDEFWLTWDGSSGNL